MNSKMSGEPAGWSEKFRPANKSIVGNENASDRSNCLSWQGMVEVEVEVEVQVEPRVHDGLWRTCATVALSGTVPVLTAEPSPRQSSRRVSQVEVPTLTKGVFSFLFDKKNSSFDSSFCTLKQNIM
jgi:hypothetical protein